MSNNKLESKWNILQYLVEHMDNTTNIIVCDFEWHENM